MAKKVRTGRTLADLRREQLETMGPEQARDIIRGSAAARGGGTAAEKQLVAEFLAKNAAVEAGRKETLQKYLASLARGPKIAIGGAAALAAPELAMGAAEGLSPIAPLLAGVGIGGSVPSTGTTATASKVPTPLAGLGKFMNKGRTTAPGVPKAGMFGKAGGFLAKNKAWAIPAGIMAAIAWYAANQSAKAQQEKEAREFAAQVAMAYATQQSQQMREQESMGQAMDLYTSQDQDLAESPIAQLLQAQALQTAQQADYSRQLGRYLAQFQPEYQGAAW